MDDPAVVVFILYLSFFMKFLNFVKMIIFGILKLFKSKNYRGSRHLYDFPVRGQRTSTNAKTQKRLQRFKKFF